MVINVSKENQLCLIKNLQKAQNYLYFVRVITLYSTNLYLDNNIFTNIASDCWLVPPWQIINTQIKKWIKFEKY